MALQLQVQIKGYGQSRSQVILSDFHTASDEHIVQQSSLLRISVAEVFCACAVYFPNCVFFYSGFP